MKDLNKIAATDSLAPGEFLHVFEDEARLYFKPKEVLFVVEKKDIFLSDNFKNDLEKKPLHFQLKASR